ncbi:MAG: HAD family hydrolase [Jatrophihabitans sp.]
MLMVATDLDRTLVYSRGAIEAYGGREIPVVPVERDEGADVSWMTACAAKLLTELHRDALLVPTTTRTPEQYERITLPGPPPRYAITANGGILLVDGAIDHDWDGVVAAELARVAPLAEVWEHAGHVCRPEWTVKLRNAHGLFCYAVLHRDRTPRAFVADVTAWADQRGWQTSLQGRKLYLVPRSLTKSAAVAEIVRRTGCERVAAAGDSLLDADLLDAADAGIAARHGELVTSGWSAPHVTVTAADGVRAGEEIVDWFAGQSGTRRTGCARASKRNQFGG